MKVTDWMMSSQFVNSGETSECASFPDRICELSVRNSCSYDASQCQYRHSQVPYQWQVSFQPDTWSDVPLETNQHIEYSFCIPSNDTCIVGYMHAEHVVTLRIHFDSFKAVYIVGDQAGGCQYETRVRRLSTCSYAEDSQLVSAGGGRTDKFVTQWRWFWHTDGSWLQFEHATPTPSQFTLESKFLHGQPLYRFHLVSEGDFLVDLRPDHFRLMSLKNGNTWNIQRRPLLPLTSPHPAPVIKPLPFGSSIPETWFPVDRDHEYEIIAVDPGKLEYHLVASAFHETVPTGEANISDVFRIQNAFLWHKYVSKRQQIQSRNDQSGSSALVERQLFHGTRDEAVVRAIFRQNFDWRISGTANDVVYGRGAYFARDARFSDRYSVSSKRRRNCWMFLARVLVGRTAVGKRDYVRPPPVNPAQPHGDLYDSCVNSLDRPTIFVVFDTDQCYPEYVIAYNRT